MAQDLATLQARLDAALEAQANVAMGGQPRVVQDQNGERVEFTAGNALALAKLILILQQQISALGGPASPLGPMRTIL
jgi:hypothetical protein